MTRCTGGDFQRILRLGLHSTSKQIVKVDRAAKKYHASRDAMLTLSDLSVVPDWNDAPPVLRVKDVCGLLMGDSEERFGGEVASIVGLD